MAGYGYDDEGDDFGPSDSDDGPDRDEYEPGGRYFDRDEEWSSDSAQQQLERGPR